MKNQISNELRDRMWVVINQRRSELIDKNGNLTDAEQTELAELQDLAIQYLDSIAPPLGSPPGGDYRSHSGQSSIS